MPSTRSASRAIRFAALVPVAPIAPSASGWSCGQRALAGLGLGDGDARLLGERAQRIGRVGVVDAAAGDDQRRASAADQRERAPERARVGQRPADVPGARLEQLDREVEGLGLHVLRQAQRDRAGLRRVGQHAHRLEQRRPELLGPVDAIPVARDGLEGVVHRHVARPAGLELLQHRVDAPRREDVAGQEQHRQAVDRRERGAGDHVRGAGADRAGARPGGEPAARAGVGDRGVHHRLLVARGHEAHALLVDRLPDAREVAVAEDAERAREERRLVAVALDRLQRRGSAPAPARP